MSKGSYITPVHRRYRLEPGNGTRYEFSITWLAISREELGQVVSGVMDGPYVTITIHDYMYPGTYEFKMESLADRRNMAYFIGKFPKAHRHDVVAVLLAASVLVNRPARVDEACEKMLRVSEILSEMEE